MVTSRVLGRWTGRDSAKAPTGSTCDAGDRITNGGFVYDAFGRQVRVAASHAGAGGRLATGYYANDGPHPGAGVGGQELAARPRPVSAITRRRRLATIRRCCTTPTGRIAPLGRRCSRTASRTAGSATCRASAATSPRFGQWRARGPRLPDGRPLRRRRICACRSAARPRRRRRCR